jgi:hypothetical protein
MSLTYINVPLANGVTVVPLNSGAIGQFEITLNDSAGVPSAGTLKVEGLNWSGNYDVIEGGTAINLPTALAGGAVITLSDFGHFQALRLTLTGVVGGAGQLYGGVNVLAAAVPDYVTTGGRAINVQSYTESNTKFGTQFYFQTTQASLAGGATYNITFTVGAKPVLVKDRSLYTNGLNVSVQLFRNSSGISGGTAIPVQNYNDINPVATTVNVLGGATVSTPGTAWGSPVHVWNASANGQGQRAGSQLAPQGDRVLLPGRSYTIQIVNNDTNAAPFDYFLTWFEGTPDLPRQ